MTVVYCGDDGLLWYCCGNGVLFRYYCGYYDVVMVIMVYDCVLSESFTVHYLRQLLRSALGSVPAAWSVHSLHASPQIQISGRRDHTAHADPTNRRDGYTEPFS